MTYCRVINEWYDEEAGVYRSRADGLFETDRERALQLQDAGKIEIVPIPAGDPIPPVTEKGLDSAPENKSLSGPPENKQEAMKEVYEAIYETPREELAEMTVAELRDLAENLELDLGDGYVKKNDLIEMIRGTF